MCERRGRHGAARKTTLAATLLTALALVPGTVAAMPARQEAGSASLEALGARYQVELDSLRPLMEEAQVRAREELQTRLAAQRAAAAAQTTVDTVRMGPFTVAVPVGRADDARPYFERAWERVAPYLDGRLPAEAGDFVFAFHRLVPGELVLASPPQLRAAVRPWAREADVQRTVDVAVAKALGQAIPGWSLLAAPEGAAEPAALAPVLRSLVTSDDPSAALCRDGHLDACWTAMGLADLRDRSLHPAARGALGQIVLEMGGPGALARFGAPPPGSDTRDRIAVAAGTTPDAVMAEWHRRVMAARRDPHEDARNLRVQSLLWVLLFAALSTRSTRWRLG